MGFLVREVWFCKAEDGVVEKIWNHCHIPLVWRIMCLKKTLHFGILAQNSLVSKIFKHFEINTAKEPWETAAP